MSEMVERVARAICLTQTQDERGWLAFLTEAQAAIAAMREPTAEMQVFGVEALIGHREPVEECSAPVWRAMIDEALR